MHTFLVQKQQNYFKKARLVLFIIKFPIYIPVELRKTHAMAQSILPKVQPIKLEKHHLRIDYPDPLLPN